MTLNQGPVIKDVPVHSKITIFPFPNNDHLSWYPLHNKVVVSGHPCPLSQYHCKWKKMDDMKVMFVFIRVMLADASYVPVNESYHYKMAFGLCAWKQT